MIYETMLNESKRLDIQIKNVQSQLKALPPGKLICSSNGKWHKWYWNNGQNTTYLSKKERPKLWQTENRRRNTTKPPPKATQRPRKHHKKAYPEG